MRTLVHMQRVVKYNINITQINSKMMNNKAEEQAVFIDFVGHSKDDVIQSLINELVLHCKGLRVIGSYTRF